MVVYVDAGLGLDQALLRTGQELATSHPVIAEEFMLINLEQRAGKPRINAWRDMADRTQLETVRGFATMLAQSDRLVHRLRRLWARLLTICGRNEVSKPRRWRPRLR
jgi:pilus assembly protein TadC